MKPRIPIRERVFLDSENKWGAVTSLLESPYLMAFSTPTVVGHPLGAASALRTRPARGVARVETVSSRHNWSRNWFQQPIFGSTRKIASLSIRPRDIRRFCTAAKVSYAASKATGCCSECFRIPTTLFATCPSSLVTASCCIPMASLSPKCPRRFLRRVQV
jgi:hypothetical protein